MVMKRIVPVFSILALAGCAATPPQYASEKQAEILAKAQAVCIHIAAEKRMPCLNKVVHRSGYWGQGVMVVAANDGSPLLVNKTYSPDQYNVGGDMYASGANPGSAR
jgi:hypothetical protein